MSIGEVAARAGLATSAIRYYESAGVLPEPERVGGRRRYEPDVLARLAVVRMAQDAGFTVAEIRELCEGYPRGTSASARWRSLAGRKLDEMDAVIARAQRMRRVLEESLRCDCLALDECAAIGWNPGEEEPRTDTRGTPLASASTT